MHRAFAFKPHLRVEPAGDGAVFLLGERERFLLKGRAYELAAPLIDGRRTGLEIIEALAGRASPPEVYYALITLESKGYIAEASSGLPPEAAALWHALGVDAARAAERLAATPVSVTALPGEAPAPLIEALTGAGITVHEDAALRVVITGDYLDSVLEEINLRALAEGRRFMLVKPGGAAPFFGPIFGAPGGPCWACLAARLAENRPVEAYVAQRTGRRAALTPPRALLPTSARAALDMAALALARFIAVGSQGPLDNQLFAMDMSRLRVDPHAVARRPQCPACGDPRLLDDRARRPLALEPRPKPFTDDGGYRCVTPEETFAQYEHLISPITGVVTGLGPMPGRDHPLRPVYGAAFNGPPAGDGAPGSDDFNRTSLGKGKTAAEARAGALCEAIERYTVIFRGDEPRVIARLSDLGEEAVHPRALLHMSASQTRRRDAINRAIRDPRRAVPPAFDEAIAIPWTPVWSLTTGARRYVPTSFCYFNVPASPEAQCCYFDPNGHAAGNCLEEAVLQAFCELAERDAVGIWWYNRVPRPQVDLASFSEPYFLELIAHYRSMGRDLWVLDVTNDLGIPSFVALARAAEGDRFCVGFGAHPEARLGVQRALTELNQIFDPAATARAPWGEDPLEDPSFLFPSKDLPPRSRADFPEARRGDLRDDVLACVDQAAKLGLETLVLDQTRPDVGLCVVKVIVPGLRHIWPRFGPGRLYDVPVRMGWRSAPLDEAELNPSPLYL